VSAPSRWDLRCDPTDSSGADVSQSGSPTIDRTYTRLWSAVSANPTLTILARLGAARDADPVSAPCSLLPAKSTTGVAALDKLQAQLWCDCL